MEKIKSIGASMWVVVYPENGFFIGESITLAMLTGIHDFSDDNFLKKISKLETTCINLT